MITYSARLYVPRELMRHVARLLRPERQAVGTRPGTRALTCFYQALQVLVWFRKGEDRTTLGVSRASAYRYVAEAVRVLAAQTPTLHGALRRVAADGWSHVIWTGSRSIPTGWHRMDRRAALEARLSVCSTCGDATLLHPTREALLRRLSVARHLLTNVSRIAFRVMLLSMSDIDAVHAAIPIELQVAPPELIFSLMSWLSRHDELRGRVTELSGGPQPGQMGAELTGMLAVAVGAGGAMTVLAQALVAWIQQSRSPRVTVRVTHPDGTGIDIGGPDAASVEGVLRAATKPAPTRRPTDRKGDVR
ncbi:effector-associated constant component EACC1 [Micromonospora saelicesensis]|uniref:effector-associated constant component EACC1 n=1 Tax=Micromonospora saelicesensis TaxID=285676 RepID=UPI003CEC4CFF